MNEYHIILEEVLTPSLRKEVLEELEKRGYIHRNVMVKPKKNDIFFISLVCDDYLLGKVASFLLSRFGWIIIEKIPEKVIKRKECVDINLKLPF